MKIYGLFFLLFVIITPVLVNGQEPVKDFKTLPTGVNDTLKVAAIIENGVLVPLLFISEVEIRGTRRWRSPEEQAAFNRLKYNVLKVMPYALYAKRRYAQLEQEIALISDKKERKKLVKQCDKEIKELFNREIKELTITQGKILTKLIDREVGKSTFDIVKETKGGFTAFIYQSVARVIGHNLKSTYNANEDRDIELIIASSGYYSGSQN